MRYTEMQNTLYNIKNYYKQYAKTPSKIAEPMHRYHYNQIKGDKNFIKRWTIGRKIERRFGEYLYCSKWQHNLIQFNFTEEMTQEVILEFMDWYINKFGAIADNFELNSRRFIVRI